jgi:3'-phosphoadenosine 5'-phosphosulfate sulfotransferase (PAPS reductase)/FAD synthetase
MVVIKPPRPMLEVWEYRWIGIIERFLNLRRVKIITPWSNSVWRFCTKSTKTAPITQYLKKRFPGREIINAVGIRREESENRRKKPISESCDELYSVKLRTSGILWYPIIELPIEEVWLTHQAEHFPRHEVYDKLGMSRVSCSFCVLASLRDLALSLNDPRNHPAFHRIVELEIKSGFSFQDGQWLSDIGFDHLSDDQKRRLEKAKELAGKRWIIEKDCPKSLTIIDNYPPYQPDMIESEMMADYRRRLCELMGIEGRYLTALSVYDRFAELLAEKEAKQQKKAAAAARKAAKALAAGIIIDVPKNEKAKKEAELPLFA